MYQYQYLYFIKLLIVIFVKIFHINDQRKVFFFIQNLNELIFIFVFLSDNFMKRGYLVEYKLLKIVK